MFTEGRQQLVYNTLQHHEAASCRSDLLYKGALQDRSRLVWRGMIKVDKAAQKTELTMEISDRQRQKEREKSSLEKVVVPQILNNQVTIYPVH